MKSEEEVLEAIRKNFSQLKIEKIESAGEGMDSKSFFVNDIYVFRFPKRQNVSQNLKIEIALLPKLKRHLSLPIPEFEFVGNYNDLTFVGYKKIEGIEISKVWANLEDKTQEATLHTLGIFLQEIHSFPVREAKSCGVPIHQFRRIYEGDYPRVAQDIYPMLSVDIREYMEKLYKEYLKDDRNFAYDPVLLHADFGAGHVFWDQSEKKVTGVIDFGDIGIGDPDYDLMYLYGEFGWRFVLRFLEHYSRKDSDLAVLRRKLRFLLAFNTIDDIWMGRDRKEKELEDWATEKLKEQIAKMQKEIFY